MTAPDTRGVLAAGRTERGFSPGWDHLGISLPELTVAEMYDRDSTTHLCLEMKSYVGKGPSAAWGHSTPSICLRYVVGPCLVQACVPRGELALEQTIAVIGNCSDPGSCYPSV